MPVFHTKTIESILEPVANQVTCLFLIPYLLIFGWIEMFLGEFPTTLWTKMMT